MNEKVTRYTLHSILRIQKNSSRRACHCRVCVVKMTNGRKALEEYHFSEQTSSNCVQLGKL